MSLPTWTLPEPDLVNRGWTLLAEGRCADAAGVMRLAAELHPQSATVRDVQGEVHLALGDRDAAASSYRDALRLDERNSFASARIAALQTQQALQRVVGCRAEQPR